MVGAMSGSGHCTMLDQQALYQQQMEGTATTLVEVVLNQELGEPFRRDAMKKPVKVAGIDRADMATEQVA